MDLLHLAALLGPLAVALLGALAWVVLRAPRPPRPSPVVPDAIADAHVRRVEHLEARRREDVADAAHVDELPDAARNRAAGARLRGGR